MLNFDFNNITKKPKSVTFILLIMVFFPIRLFASPTNIFKYESIPIGLIITISLISIVLTVLINYVIIQSSFKRNMVNLKNSNFDYGEENAAAMTMHDSKTEVHNPNYINTTDILTQLPNRKHLFDYLQYITTNKSNTFDQHALMIINIDFFRSVNNNLGHEVGDKILIECANRLQSLFPDNSFVARMDGDEFAVVHKINDTIEIEAAADKILDSMKQPVMIFNQEVYVSVSIGISLFPNQCSNPNDLIKNAASSVNVAKNTRRSSYTIYSPEAIEYSHHKFNIYTELCQAIEHNQFVLHYQPKIDGKTAQIVGIEALIRWNHPKRGLLYPIDFIPIAEETGIIKHIDEWVLNTACTQLKKWIQDGIKNLRLAVNLSAWQFKDQHLVDIVTKVIKDTGIEPSYLELEITETVALENLSFTQNTLAKLMDMGVSISIDDFGTGYSSLNYLKHFPISFLKIDKSFVADIINDKNTYSIVKAVIDVAHALQLKVIAEGVENQEQLELLQNMDCDEIQGYHVSKPLNVDDIKSHIIDHVIKDA